MKNIALRLRYIGTKYHGWQLQKDDVSVAGTVENALSRLIGEPIRVSGCGRTDAGVHAEVYCANFKSDTTIPTDRLPYALNTFLPQDIVVQKAMYVPDDFDSTLSCVKKEYTYRIICSKMHDPFYANRVFFYNQQLAVEKMKAAAKHFVGTHDFASVRSVGTDTKTTVRTVYHYEVEQVGDIPIIELRACANGFLYNMARAMAGTLIYVSEGKINADDLPKLLEQKNRSLAGPTLPPDGLYLTALWYDGDVGKVFEG